MNEKATKRGRPADPMLQEARKEYLVDAAFEFLWHRSYRSITIRDIASEAGTQSAMIKYYFGDKQEFFLALLDRISNQQMTTFQTVLDAPNSIKAFIETTIRFVSQNPPIIRLMADEVLTSDRQLKQAFIEMIPKRMAALLPELMGAMQQAGRLRKYLDPKWVAFSLVSLILFLFTGGALREQAWNIGDDERFSSCWADYIYRLFTEGVRL